jgi:hypothetical protein
MASAVTALSSGRFGALPRGVSSSSLPLDRSRLFTKASQIAARKPEAIKPAVRA